MNSRALTELEFHHLGVACSQISREIDAWKLLGYEEEGGPFIDPLQGVSGQFMVGLGPRVELLEPLPLSKTLDPFLKAGIKIYHTAYITQSLGLTIDSFVSERALILSHPKPAIAFGGRQVAFLALRSRHIIELIEAETSAN